ncbi:MAG: S8 family serine peptidase [Bacillota bacterium]|nr:S8 family serine peptidase [Bacillota bacterium]
MSRLYKKYLSFLLSVLLTFTGTGPLFADSDSHRYQEGEAAAITKEVLKEKYPLSSAYLNAEQENSETSEKIYVLQFEDGRKDEMLEKLSKIEGLELKYQYDSIFEGASVKVGADKLAKIRDMDGIKHIQENGTFVPKMVSAKEMTKIKEAYDYNEEALKTLPEEQRNAGKLDGRGIIVAVIDSGIDVGHEAMRIDEEAKPFMKIKHEDIAPGFTDKVPHGFSYVGGGSDLMDKVIAGHGMHCAGIIAGNSDRLKGVVPNAQIFSYRIFSDQYYEGDPEKVAGMYEFGGDDSVYHAIDDAVKHGADVISMSIGQAGNGYAGDLYYETVNRAAERGVVIVSAIGNYGSASSDNTFDNSPVNELGLTDTSAMTYYSGIGRILAVGSVTNVNRESKLIQIGDKSYPYTTLGTEQANEKAMKANVGDLDFVFVGHGRASAYKGLNVDGKIVIALRDGARNKGSRIVDKIKLAKEKKAKGIILLNAPISYSRDNYQEYPIISYANDPGMSKVVEDGRIFAISLNGKDGDLLRKQIAEKANQAVSFPNETVMTPLTAQAKVSGFTGWGPNAELELKPELVAPGENVFSSMNRDKYGHMSGTSMATPHVAGVSAMMVQKVNELVKHPFFAEIGKSDTNKILLMNSAEPMKDYINTALEVSPRRQGAGMVRADKAIRNQVFVTHNKKAYVQLKDFTEDSKSFTLRLDNLSDTDRSFELDYSKILCEGVKVQQKLSLKPDKIKIGEFEDSFDTEDVKVSVPVEMDGAEISSEKSEITVPTKSHAELSFTLRTPSVDSNAEGKFVEGFLYFKSKDENAYPSLSIPYLGFKGDWQKGRIIDKPMWEEDSVYKHTTVVGIYASDEHGNEIKYKILGVDKSAYPRIKGPHGYEYDEERLKAGHMVDPNKIAFSVGFLAANPKQVSLRMIALREVKDLEVAILNDKKEPIRIVSTSQNYRKQIHNVIHESDWQARVFHRPNLLFQWDGKVYDAKKGEMKLVPSGQYYYRIRAKVKDTEDYEETLMPVKVDNSEPKAGKVGQKISEDGHGRDITFTIEDENELMFVGASLDNKPVEVKKLSEHEYKIENLKLNELTKSRLHIEAMDYATNLMEPIEIDLNDKFLELKNYEEVLKGESDTLQASIENDSVALIEAFQGEKALDLVRTGSTFEVKLDNNVEDLRLLAKDEDGNVIGEDRVLLQALKAVPGAPQKHGYGATDYEKMSDDESARFRRALDYGLLNYYIITASARFITEENGRYYFNPSSVWAIELDETAGFNLEDYNLEATAYNILAEGHEDYQPTWSWQGSADSVPDEPNIRVYDGTNIINLTFTEKSSGRLIFSRGVLVMLDTSKPELSLDEGILDQDKKVIYANSNEITIMGQIRDNLDEVYLDLNGDNIVTKLKQGDFFGNTHARFEKKITVQDGDIVTFKTKDRFGNHEEIHYTIVMDNVAPLIEIGEDLDKDSTLEVRVSDENALRDGSTQVLVNGRPYRDGSKLGDYNEEGKFFIEVTAVDKAGNVAEATKEIGLADEDKDFSKVTLSKNTFTKEEAKEISRFINLPEGMQVIDSGAIDLESTEEQDYSIVVQNAFGVKAKLTFKVRIGQADSPEIDLDKITLKKAEFLAEELSEIKNLFDLPAGVIARVEKLDASTEGEKELKVKFINQANGKSVDKVFQITVLPELKAELKKSKLTLNELKQIANLIKEDARFHFAFEKAPKEEIGLQRIGIKIQDKYGHEKVMYFDIEVLSNPAVPAPKTPEQSGNSGSSQSSPSGSSDSGRSDRAHIKDEGLPKSKIKKDEDKTKADLTKIQISDIDGHWAKEVILKALSEALIKGYPDGSFKPNNEASRSEFASLVNRLFKYESKKFIEFEDVERDAWYQNDLQALVDKGIVKGSGSLFMPAKAITREEIASMLVRYIEREKPDLLKGELKEWNFVDKEEISDWAKADVKKAYSLGLLSGDDRNMLMAKKTATRAELVKMIYNFKNVLAM